MNTTHLIQHWSMEGVEGDIAGLICSESETREEQAKTIGPR
jgi:hypothetical protein